MNTTLITMGLILIIGAAGVPAEKDNQALPHYPGWEMVWHDEFDTDGRADPTTGAMSTALCEIRNSSGISRKRLL